jgi:hypothetical protein
MDNINNADIQLMNKKENTYTQSNMMITLMIAVVVIVIIVVVIILRMKVVEDQHKVQKEQEEAASAAMSKNKEQEEAVAVDMSAKVSDKKPENFTNDLPNEHVKIEDKTSYSDAIQEMALDKSVVQQHASYVNERNKITSTASFNPSRSDTQDVVPFVGLRRPQYSFNNKDLVDSTARVVPSEVDANQLSKHVELRWS